MFAPSDRFWTHSHGKHTHQTAEPARSSHTGTEYEGRASRFMLPNGSGAQLRAPAPM
jgi:hypothetical protein